MEGGHLLVWEDLIEIQRELSGRRGWQIVFEPEMQHLTTWKIGGRARALITVEDIQALNGVIAYLESRGFFWRILGKGSNILIDDRGFDGVVIRLGGDFERFSRIGTSQIEAGSGARLIKLVNYSLHCGLTGLEFLVGVPGSIGGAVLVNAGCFGQEIGCLIQKILIREPSGTVRWLNPAEAGFTYRHSSLRNTQSVILKARFQLTVSTTESVRERIKQYHLLRNRTQPTGLPSAGCVFKNPHHDHAARIIEMMGLKGVRAGDAQVSDRHSNFIVNRGKATSREVKFLIWWIRNEIFRKKGILLENEIEVW